MTVTGPSNLKNSVMESTQAIKSSIQATDLSPADKQKVISAIDSTSINLKQLPNTLVYQIAMLILGAITITIIIGIIILKQNAVDIPETLSVGLGAVIGAVVGIFSANK